MSVATLFPRFQGNVKAVSAAVAPAILAAHGNEAEVARILRDAIHAALEHACDELERQA